MLERRPANAPPAPQRLPRTLEALARVLGGRLELSSMPPANGPLTPFGRVVTDHRAVRAGDVLLPVVAGSGQALAIDRDDDRLYRWWEAQQAFALGAAAVVVADPGVQPWAGATVIQVADLERAAGRWQQYGSGYGNDEQTSEHRRLRRGGRNCGISTLPSLLG